MKKILIVFGTRPEAIKMAPLILELRKRKSVEVLVCVTGQHREMLDQVLNLFNIIPDFDLNLMKRGQDLFDITSGVLLGLKDILKKSKPNIVLVHGDTSTSTAAALAAYYERIPVGHIEAGLRTNDIYSPFPEELNRQITARISKYHFSPTLNSKENLILEGIASEKIYVTGNTGIDALHIVLDMIKGNLELKAQVQEILINAGLPKTMFENDIPDRKIVLITGHRRENFGQGFINICQSIKKMAIMHPSVDFIYPVHLNPNVRQPIARVFGQIEFKNIFFIEPLDYLPFVFVMSASHIVLTDSGGIQEEAPSLGKPVLVMRETTERPEAVSSGTAKLVGTDEALIIKEITQLLSCSEYYLEMAKATNPYGDGYSSVYISDCLE